MSDIDAELAAIHAYQEKHDTCDIQKHPWQAVFGAGFQAGATAVRAEKDAEIERLRIALRDADRWLLQYHNIQAARDTIRQALGDY